MKARRYILLFAWLILASGTLAHLWLTHPDAVPRVPASLATWLVGVYGSRNGEELADLEDLFALAASFLLVALSTAIVCAIRKRQQTRRAKD
jgi:hypothetical protein